VQEFVRDLLELKAEVIAEMFDPETLTKMTGAEQAGQALELMRQDGLRGFRIDIETDSTIAADEQTDKREITEMFSALSSLIQQMIPAVQGGVIPMPAAKEMVLWGMRRFRVSRQVEDLMQQDPQPQPDRPDPLEMAKLQTQERQSQRDFQLKLLELKKDYAEMESDELREVLEQSVKLVEQQEQPFREAFQKLSEAAATNDQAGVQ
jgi:hypothetical protein